MCAGYVLNIIVLEFLRVGESLPGRVSCFPTADADEKQSMRNWVSLGWYFHRCIPLDRAVGGLPALRGER